MTSEDRIKIIEKIAQHDGVLFGNSKGLWNRFATKGTKSMNSVAPQAKTPSFQASPFKPLYPKQPKTNNVVSSSYPTAKQPTGSLFNR